MGGVTIASHVHEAFVHGRGWAAGRARPAATVVTEPCDQAERSVSAPLFHEG